MRLHRSEILIAPLGYDGRAIANYMLEVAASEGIRLTNLQLQKIVFFAHGTYLSLFNAPLVLNRFEAWEHGPVIPELYHALKQYGDRPITSAVNRYDLESQSYVLVTAEITVSDRQHIAETLKFYGRMNPWELVRLSHVSNGPWSQTIERSKNRANFSLVIDPQVIKRFFDNPNHNLQ
jgi:uncharacterized phage-associated protein